MSKSYFKLLILQQSNAISSSNSVAAAEIGYNFDVKLVDVTSNFSYQLNAKPILQ